MKKLMYILFFCIAFLVGIYGINKVYKIITRFDYDKLEKISFESVKDKNQTCFYVFYTLDNDPLTNHAIDDIYALNQTKEGSCEIYVVYMNDLANQKHMYGEITQGINLDALPTLVEFKEQKIVNIKIIANDKKAQ